MNIAELLKDCPEGTKLYSPLLGDCFLDYVNLDDPNYPIKVTDERHKLSFVADGRYLKHLNGECLLFPSRDNRDWSTFKAPKKEYLFKPFDKVLVRNTNEDAWKAAYFSHWNISISKDFFPYSTESGYWAYCIPYECNEHLVGTTDNPE